MSAFYNLIQGAQNHYTTFICCIRMNFNRKVRPLRKEKRYKLIVLKTVIILTSEIKFPFVGVTIF